MHVLQVSLTFFLGLIKLLREDTEEMWYGGVTRCEVRHQDVGESSSAEDVNQSLLQIRAKNKSN